MATLLFRLRGVPDDEAQDVRTLLERESIRYYETDAGNWGISMPAIWLESDQDLPRARQLIESYQCERTQRERADYRQRRRAGSVPGFRDRLMERPLAVLAIAMFCAGLLYLMLAPFLRLAFSGPA